MTDWPCMVTVDVEHEWETDNPRAVDEYLPRLLAEFERRGIAATLFCTGAMAVARADLLRAAGRQHELASHALSHRPFHTLSPAALEMELRESKAQIEALGAPCAGFRAPYFYMTDPILAAVARAGYRYDSSWASFALHIGYHNLRRHKTPAWVNPPGIFEIPIPDVSPARIPFGLSYYRLFQPLRALFHQKRPHLIYMHCDEFLEAPAAGGIPVWARPFLNRHRGAAAWSLLMRLLEELSGRGARFVTCSEFMEASAVRVFGRGHDQGPR